MRGILCLAFFLYHIYEYFKIKRPNRNNAESSTICIAEIVPICTAESFVGVWHWMEKGKVSRSLEGVTTYAGKTIKFYDVDIKIIDARHNQRHNWCQTWPYSYRVRTSNEAKDE